MRIENLAKVSSKSVLKCTKKDWDQWIAYQSQSRQRKIFCPKIHSRRK